jgi:threonine dehydrogenase-like Zn-dependent dehydrogenase
MERVRSHSPGGEVQDVLIIGDGPIGLLCTWLAGRVGLRPTLAVKHGNRAELGRELGASDIVNVADASHLEGRFPVVIEAVGGTAATTYTLAVSAARVAGLIVLLGVPSASLPAWNTRDLARKEVLLTAVHSYRREHFLAAIDQLAREGAAVSSLVDHPIGFVDVASELPKILSRSPRPIKVAIVVP